MIKSTTFIVISILALLLLGGMLWLIWINRGTERTIGVLLKAVLAPMVVAAFLLAHEMFAPLPAEKARFFVFVPRQRKSCELIYRHLRDHNSKHAEIIGLTSRMAFNSKAVPKDTQGYDVDHVNYGGSFHLDRMQLVFLAWLMQNYSRHWDQQHTVINYMSGWTTDTFIKEGAEPKPRRISQQFIREKLRSENLVYKGGDPFRGYLSAYNTFSIPRHSQIEFQRTNSQRIIIIETKEVTFKIMIGAGGGDTVGPGAALGKKVLGRFPELVDTRNDYFLFEFDYQVKRFWRWSPRTIRLTTWKNELIERFRSEGSYDLIQDEIMKYF